LDFKEIILIGVGAVAFVWVITLLSDFVGTSPLMLSVGTPALIGIGCIFFGGLFVYYVKENHLN